MNPNLKWKALFIFVVILFCIYFLFGYPVFPTSVAQIKDNFSKQIKLGLDLQGGTHLILQVQVQEAVAQETDTTVDRLTTLLRSKNIHYDEVRRVDDTHILVRNVDSSQVAEFRDLVTQQYNNVWDLARAAGDPSGYTLTLRPSAIAQIQDQFFCPRLLQRLDTAGDLLRFTLVQCIHADLSNSVVEHFVFDRRNVHNVASYDDFLRL